MVKFTDVSNLAAWGVEWTSPDSGVRNQLVLGRGSTRLTYAFQAPGNTEWSSVYVEQPERFGVGESGVKTRKEWHAVVSAFLAPIDR